MSGAKQRTHAMAGSFRSALATAVAIHALRTNLSRGPTKVPSGGFCFSRRLTTQRPNGPGRFSIDNFSRIENLPRVEYGLNLPKHWIEASVLPRDPRGAGQSGTVLRADRTPQVQGQTMHLLGNDAELGAVLPSAEV